MNLTPANIDSLLSGRRRGVLAATMRGFLRLAEIPYGLVIAQRNEAYDRGARETVSTGVPVISVGNLTTGGTGKTPFVKWLTRWFRQRGVRVGILSRGYKSTANVANDEARELAEQLPDVPHLQNPDRVAAARMARTQYGCELLILDDAFQHRRIRRDLDIVLLDALQPFGYGHLLPRGMLREPMSALRRAQVIVLSRADFLDEPARQSIRARALESSPQAVWVESAHAPVELRNSAGDVAPLKALAGQSIAGFCGIGNPTGFRRTLESCTYRVAGFREFPDHHAYSQPDLASLAEWAAHLDQAQAVVCTQKDLVKMDALYLGQLPLWALAVDLQILNNAQGLIAQLERVLDTA